MSSQEDVLQALDRAARQGQGVSVAGGRHAMGAQQLGTNTLHLDMRPLRRILHFDSRAGLLEVEAGIQWRELVDAYLAIHAHSQPQWGLIQK